MHKKVVIALGGNAIQTTDGSSEAQKKAIRATMQTLKPLFKTDYDIVISHGNGPQIGNLLIQQQKADSPETRDATRYMWRDDTRDDWLLDRNRGESCISRGESRP